MPYISADPRVNIAYEIRGTFKAFENTLVSSLAETDLSIDFFHILRIDWPEQGRTQIEVARLAFLSASVASKQIQKMCKAGLLHREQGSYDSKRKIIKLTHEGREKRKHLIAPILTIPKTATEPMSDEDIRTTLRVLRQLRANLKGDNPPYQVDLINIRTNTLETATN